MLFGLAWYFSIPILLYFAIGCYLGGLWMSEEGENLKHFFFSLLIIVAYPFLIGITIFMETPAWSWVKNAFSELNPVRKYRDYKDRKKDQEEIEDEYDLMRLERMGLNDDIWKTDVRRPN